MTKREGIYGAIIRWNTVNVKGMTSPGKQYMNMIIIYVVDLSGLKTAGNKDVPQSLGGREEKRGKRWICQRVTENRSAIQPDTECKNAWTMPESRITD